MTPDTLQTLVQDHGIWLVAGAAIIEGPIATVVGAYAASLGLLSVVAVYIVCVLGDIIGDVLLYSLGRFGLHGLPDRWRSRFGLNRSRLASLGNYFRAKGGRTLVFGKLAHSPGMAVLVAAGAARMPFFSFLFWNFVSSLPKTLAFVFLGYTIGYAYTTIDNYIFRVSLLIGVVTVGVLGFIYYRHRSGQSGSDKPTGSEQ